VVAPGAHRIRFAIPFAALALSLLGSGCGGTEATRPPDLVLVVVDTLRADHLGAYGYERPTSPVIDALAARGLRFENAAAPSSWTRPSVASLFTSRLPSEHGAVSLVAPLDPAVPTFVEALRDAGYRTVGVSGNFPNLSDKSGLTRGFETFASLAIAVGGEPGTTSGEDTLMRLPLREDGGQLALRAPTADEVNARVFEELDALEGPGDAPLLLYVHYMDPHSGYLAPPRFRALFERRAADTPPATSDYLVELASGRRELAPGERERLVDAYDAEIRYVDEAIGRLLEGLEARGLAGSAVVTLVSDHGEELGEHGGYFHGLTLHRELLRVPLVIRDERGLLPTGVRTEPVELLDVPVTLLALAGLEPLPGMRGRALFAAEAESLGATDRVAELHPDPAREAHAGPLRHAASVTRWPFKAVADRAGDVSVYRLDADPGERAPVDASAHADLVAEARRLAGALAVPDAPAALSPEERAGLRALGYLE